MRTGNTTMRAPRALALGAVGVLVLAGCGAGGNNLTLATGSTGGTYYPLGGEIAQLWSDNIDDVNVSTQATGASVENLRLLDNGENELVLAINGVAANAANGEADFSDEPLANPDDVTLLGNVYPEVLQIVATEESGIESVADLKGKRVDMGPPGSGTEVAARQLLESQGWDPENDVETFNSTFEEATTKLSDGQVDAAVAILAVPAASIEQVATGGTDITMVEIAGEEAEQLMEDNPSYSTMEIPGGTYQGQEQPVQTLTNWASLYSTSDLDEDVAHDLVQEMYEGADDIGHNVGDQLDAETAVESQGPTDLHPGAERYYEEAGVLD